MVREFLVTAAYLAASLGANVAAAQDLSALAVGEMRGLVIHETPVAATDLPYLIDDDRQGTLSDYAGRHVLLNFWATWCAPCRAEMPSLQALQDQLGGDTFQVVTLATGRNSPQAIRRFFSETGVTSLPQYRDIDQQIAREMGVLGLPITVLLNRDGQEIARMRGEADWSAPEAVALIEAAIARGS